MFAANAELNIGACSAATLDCDFDKVANPVLVERHKGVFLHYPCGDVIRQEAARIITREAKCGLR